MAGSQQYGILYIDNNNKLYAQGYNSSGQMGIGDLFNRPTPTLVTTAPPAIQVDAGLGFSALISEAKELYVTGNGAYGKLGLNDTSNRNTWTKVPNISDVEEIALGSNHMLVRLTNGDVYATGFNANGQLGLGDFIHRDELTKIPTLSNVVKIAAGDNISAAITADGFLYTWGAGTNYATGLNITTDIKIPTKTSVSAKFVNVSLGNCHGVAITDTGEVYTWGYGYNGQLGHGNNANKTIPTKVANVSGIVKAVCGLDYTVLLDNNKNIWVAGKNDKGQLGLNDSAIRTYFELNTFPVFQNRVIDISCAQTTTYVLLDTLELYAFGSGAYGALGNGDESTSASNFSIIPIKVNDVSNIIVLAGSIREKTYPVDQPTDILVSCSAQNGLAGFDIKASEPAGTGIRFLFSTDNITWKAYNPSTGTWDIVDKSTARTNGNTIAQVEALKEEDLTWLNNVPFYINVTMWTTDSKRTPIFSGIDAFVNLNTQSPTVSSLSINHNIKKPETPTYYVSRDDGITWKEVEPDQLVSLTDLPEGNKIKVKAVLSNGLELHGISYSWI
jgi:alpha-tubulin suppressor-like RCC1 family protein